MSAPREPYVKVYYAIVDDSRFESVYDDDAALATWLRLLLLADGTYPAPAPVPQGTKPKALARLISAGLVDMVPGHRYRIHGLHAEREKRSSAGKAGADARWNAPPMRTQSDGNANAMAPHSAKNASQSNSTQSNSTQSRDIGRTTPPRGLLSVRDPMAGNAR